MGAHHCLEDFENPFSGSEVFDNWSAYRNVSCHWSLAEEYAVNDAALLILGLEPQGARSEIRRSYGNDLPDGYEAILTALRTALKCGKIKGHIVPEVERDFNRGSYEVPGTVDCAASWVSRDSLIKWLEEVGYTDCPIFQVRSRPSGFRDPIHPRYSAKLAAVTAAWEAFDESADERGTPKQRLATWLRLNAARYGLVNDEGKPSENVIEELAKVANWATTGGAPKLSQEEARPDKFPF
jgi:hypothetical protein